jgi:hypothetical protein
MYFCPTCNAFTESDFCKECASHTFESPDTDPLQIIQPECEESITKILIQGNYLIVQSLDADHVTSMRVVDITTGRRLFKLTYPQPKETSVSALGHEDYLCISIRCEDILTCGGGIYFFRLPELPEPVWSWGKDLFLIITPLLHNKYLFAVANDRKLHILDIFSGNEITYQHLEVSPNISGMVANESTLFLLGQFPHIKAFNINKKTVEWEIKYTEYADTRIGFFNSALYDDNICTVLDNGAILCAREGRINWVKPPQDIVKDISQMYSAGNKCLITDRKGTIHALEILTGKVTWKIKIGGKVNHISPFGNNLLAVSSENGNVYIVDNETGNPIWLYQQKDTKLPIKTHETTENQIFAGYSDGSIRLFIFPPNLDTQEKQGFSYVLNKSYPSAKTYYVQAGKTLDAKRLSAILPQQTFKEITDRIVTTGERERLSRLKTKEIQPPLFQKNGLCAGQELDSYSPNSYFLGHEFNAEKIGDLRLSLIEGLGSNFKPYTPDMEIASKLRLCRIASKIQTSLFCIFDIPESNDRNVYLEIGLAIGLRRKFFLLHKANLQPPDSLSALGAISFSSYTGLKHELKDKQETFLVFRENTVEDEYHEYKKENCYLISPGEARKEDFISTVKKALGIRNIEPIILGQQPNNGFKIDLITEQVGKSLFGIYEINTDSKPDNFIALGVAIGMGQPFLLISKSGKEIPTDLHGLDYLEYLSISDLQHDLITKSGSFFDRYIQKGSVMTMPKNFPQVFLCCSSADQNAAYDIYTRLIRDGVDAWLNQEKLIPGQNWELETRKAVRKSDAVIVCLSKQFNQAGFQQKEVRWAIDTAMEQPEGKIYIIPARLDNCEMPESLRHLHGVDLFEADGYERLVQALMVSSKNKGR